MPLLLLPWKNLQEPIDMYLIGASGHAKVILDCLEDMGIQVLGLFDKNPALKILNGIPVVGVFPQTDQEAPLIIAVGDNKTRAKLAEQLMHKVFAQAIHPSALISKHVYIDEGTVVFHGSIIQSTSHIGKHVILNTSSSVDHDCVVGDYAHIAPKATLCGNVTIGEGTLVGVGAVVVPGVTIGKWCTVGAGAVVLEDIPDYAVVVGNPAKIIKYVHEA